MSDPMPTRPAEISPSGKVVVVDPDGAIATPGHPVEPADPTGQVSAPDKVMRIGTMVKQLLDEVRSAPLDDRSRVRLRELHAQSIKELGDGLAPELRDELGRLALPFSDDEVPSDAELRVAQAQLVGWLEGVFHGVQAALVTQQMTLRAQVEGKGRGQLPPGAPVAPGEGGGQGTGQYL